MPILQKFPNFGAEMAILPAYIRADFRRNAPAWWVIVVATLVLIVFTFRKDRLTTNPLSRFITVERLLEAGTFAHTSPEGDTPFELSIDHVKVNGQIYSSKPPSYPALMAAEAWPLRKLTGMNVHAHKRDYLRYLTLLNQVLPFALMLITALFFLQRFVQDRFALAWMLMAMSFGSLAYGYAVTINNHTVAAVLFFVSFALLYGVEKGDRGPSASFWAGLMASFAAMNELPGLVFLAFFGVMLLRVRNWRALAAFALGASIPILFTLWAYHHITGSYKPTYMQGDLYRYEGSYWKNPEGLDTLRDPWYVYLFHSFLGHHGMFSMTPVLALGLWGGIRIIRKNLQGMRFHIIGLFLGMLAITVFVVRNTHNYGGYCIGLRWFIPFAPLLMMMAWPIVAEWVKESKGRIALWVILLLSTPWVFQSLWIEAFVRSTWDKWWLGEQLAG